MEVAWLVWWQLPENGQSYAGRSHQRISPWSSTCRRCREATLNVKTLREMTANVRLALSAGKVASDRGTNDHHRRRRGGASNEATSSSVCTC